MHTLLQETVPYLRTLQEQYPEQPSISNLIERIETEISQEEEATRQAEAWGKHFITLQTDGTLEDWLRQMNQRWAAGLASEYVGRGVF